MPPPEPRPSYPPSAMASETSSTVPLRPPPSHAPARRLRSSCTDWPRAAGAWLRGPDPPVDVSFVPLWPAAQKWPSAQFRRVVKQPRSQVLVLAGYCAVWFALFATVIHFSAFADAVRGTRPFRLSCAASLWCATPPRTDDLTLSPNSPNPAPETLLFLAISPDSCADVIGRAGPRTTSAALTATAAGRSPTNRSPSAAQPAASSRAAC